MNEKMINDIIGVFEYACPRMSDAYSKKKNNIGNIERKKIMSIYKRFLVDKELFEICMDKLLENESVPVSNCAATFCLSREYKIDNAKQVLENNKKNSEKNYDKVDALMVLFSWNNIGNVEVNISEPNEIKKKQIKTTAKDVLSYSEYIRTYLGKSSKIDYEFSNWDNPIDIMVIAPNASRNYYTLVTIGLFYYVMPVLDSKNKMNRAELTMNLPDDWQIDNMDTKWQRPIVVMREFIKKIYEEKSYIGRYQYFDFGEMFSEKTQMGGIVLDMYDEELEPLTLENGDQIIMYNILPIYQEEMMYCKENGGKKLVDKISKEKAQYDLKRFRTI